MNQSSDASQAFTGSDTPLDPREAAAMLNQATQQARRTFTPGQPLLWLFRAVGVLAVFGSLWLSVRHQNPYVGPRGWALAVTFGFVAINIAWSVLLNMRAGTGVSGPGQRQRQAWMAFMLAVFIIAYVVTSPLYANKAGHPGWGLYPANAPLLIVGAIGAVSSAIRRDWLVTGITFALAIVALIGGFGGLVNSWLVTGIGMCVLCLSACAAIIWRQHRTVVEL